MRTFGNENMEHRGFASYLHRNLWGTVLNNDINIGEHIFIDMLKIPDRLLDYCADCDWVEVVNTSSNSRKRKLPFDSAISVMPRLSQT